MNRRAGLRRGDGAIEGGEVNRMPSSKKILLGAVNKQLAETMLKQKGRELATALRDSLPENYRCFVILDDGGTTAFFSDSTREEAIALLRSCLAKLEGA